MKKKYRVKRGIGNIFKINATSQTVFIFMIKDLGGEKCEEKVT